MHDGLLVPQPLGGWGRGLSDSQSSGPARTVWWHAIPFKSGVGRNLNNSKWCSVFCVYKMFITGPEMGQQTSLMTWVQSPEPWWKETANAWRLSPTSTSKWRFSLTLTPTRDNNRVLMESLCSGGLNKNVPRRLGYLNTWSPSPLVSVDVRGVAVSLARRSISWGRGWGRLWESTASPYIQFTLPRVLSESSDLSPSSPVATVLFSPLRTLLQNCEPR